LPLNAADANIDEMKRSLVGAGAFGIWILVSSTGWPQTLAPSPGGSSDEKLEAISKKIDEQNKKIDLLSQEILKLEQQLANARPGVMIGEGAPNYSPSPASAIAVTPNAQNGNSHTVARGETLTSIAKMYNVSVIELQKYNHIENDRKLQIGQTLAIPGSATPAASPSPSASSGG
jgi:LysM repeat protein